VSNSRIHTLNSGIESGLPKGWIRVFGFPDFIPVGVNLSKALVISSRGFRMGAWWATLGFVGDSEHWNVSNTASVFFGIFPASDDPLCCPG
jgi:hypothetical protein